MKDYCYHSYGCRVVLKLYDIIAITDDSLIEGFGNYFVEKNVEAMMTDLNANYIIQKVIHLQPSSKLGFISDLFSDKVACDYFRLRSSAKTLTHVECCKG